MVFDVKNIDHLVAMQCSVFRTLGHRLDATHITCSNTGWCRPGTFHLIATALPNGSGPPCIILCPASPQMMLSKWPEGHVKILNAMIWSPNSQDANWIKYLPELVQSMEAPSYPIFGSMPWCQTSQDASEVPVYTSMDHSKVQFKVGPLLISLIPTDV